MHRLRRKRRPRLTERGGEGTHTHTHTHTHTEAHTSPPPSRSHTEADGGAPLQWGVCYLGHALLLFEASHLGLTLSPLFVLQRFHSHTLQWYACTCA